MAAGALAFVSTRLGERCGAHGAVMGGVTALPTPVSEPGLQMAESESVSPTRSEPASSHESAGGVRVGRTAARPPAPAVMGTVAAPQPASPPPRATMGVMRRVD